MKHPARLLLLALAILVLPIVTPAHAQTTARCFAETPYCIEGRVREFWEQNGGLAAFGLPIGPFGVMTVEGKAIQAQPFERNRLEYHPEKQRPYDIQLGRLGVDVLTQQGRDWFTFPKGAPREGCRFFTETSHTVCGDFLTAFRASGLEFGQTGVTEVESLALFGMPLSEVLTETLSDGKQYQIQWFERARFELHPENQPPYTVLLGLLGRELGGSTPAPVAPAPVPAAQPVPPPSTPPQPPPSSVDPGQPSYPCQPGQVKGNRNSGIYHAPGQRDYARTRANVQCFDTEAQAQAAGYRRAQR